MFLQRGNTDTALGVECAWPLHLQTGSRPASPRQGRLANAWRRLAAVFQRSRRSNWSR